MEKLMAPDERDRKFDKALAHHLRSAAPTEAPGIPGVSSSQSDACPDPETLAAYHERSLLPEQLNSLKEHIVGCANCQTILAHLEMTDEIPLQAAEEVGVFAETAATSVLPTVGPAKPPSVDAVARKSRRLRLLRGARWQWLAPAGAIAAVLLVWIALHENYTSPLPSRSENESKMAQNKVPPAPVPSLSTAAPQNSAREKSATPLTRPQSTISEPASANGRAISGATKQIPASSDASGARPANSLADKDLRAQKELERDDVVERLTAPNQAELDAKNLPEESRKKEDSPAQAEKVQAETAQLQNSQAQNQTNNYISPKTPGPSPMNQVQSPAKAKSTSATQPPPAPSAPPSQPTVVAGAESSYNDTASLKVAREVSNPRMISSPALDAFWRVGRRGLIEFSKDGRSSWSRQTSGVLSDLLTGSALSNQVCWIAGRAGAILLTTDGGAHWKAVPSPLTEDLGGIHASDALHATVWNTRSTKSFETSDGGLTWKPAPNP
jgi:photosystem II stability/assembly factor-like uncharacterized protein